MVKELVSKDKLWNKILIEKVEDRKEFVGIMGSCAYYNGGGIAHVYYPPEAPPSWSPC